MTYIFNPTILREYDIRGVVDKTITQDDAYAIARSTASIADKQGLPPTAVIGYDGRLSSPEMAEGLIKGFKDSGYDVINVGLCPTPLVYMAGKEFNTSVAIMVTGSHNPPEYNGFKIMLNGKSFFGKDITILGEVARDGDWINGEGTSTDKDFSDFYANRLLQDYNMDASFNVVWDSGNGSMGAVLEKITSRLPGNHILINNEVDGTFPAHHPDPTVESNLEQLKEEVLINNFDMGIAFDGDGDRIGIIDNQARVLWGDQMLCVLAKPVLKSYPGASILSDVKASDVLFQEIERMGGKGIMVATGHSIVKTRMIEEKSPLAGEMSAHIFFADTFYGHDDALYVALRFMKAVWEENKTVADIRDALPQMVNTPEIRIEVKEEDKFPIIANLKQTMLDKGVDVCDIDGVRVRTDLGWWLCRASNTQNAITMRFEASTQEDLDTIMAGVEALLAPYGVALK